MGSNPDSRASATTSKILFTADNRLCMINPDGSNMQVLATGRGASVDWQAHISRDGTKVVYAQVDTTFQQIFLIDLLSSRTINLTGDTIFHDSPSFSPDGKNVLYITSERWMGSICLKNITTGESSRLTQGLSCYSPVFSPGGLQIAFTLSLDGVGPRVAIMDKDRSGIRDLGSGDSPQFFPDGHRILFRDYLPAQDADGLFSMNIDGSERKFLCKIPWQTFPKVSPDGRKIVLSDFTDNPEIFVMNSDGSNRVNLTNSPAGEYTPSFSPDGTKIVYVTWESSSGHHLDIMNADGSDKKTIVKDFGTLRDPVFWH